MTILLYITAGIIIGAILGWLIAKGKTVSTIQTEKDAAQINAKQNI